MRLLLIGCTGLVGRGLVPLLRQQGHELVLVSRTAGQGDIEANPASVEAWRAGAPLANSLAAADAVINLAGEPIAERRWTPAQRQLLRDSRISTTSLLVAAINACPSPPQLLIQGSAVGYYGSSATASFTEASPAAADFLGQLCQHWEAATQELNPACRLVILRTGIVLAADGGALGKMLPIFRLGFGGPVGSGQQWMSWIHRHDYCSLVAAALTDPAWSGVYNATAPEPATMANFCQSLGRALARPSLLPVPAALLQLLLGDGASVVLEGQRVLPQRLQQQGFTFKYPQLDGALADCLKA
jgi:uncharacterized protein (TIGR01777 family)